MPKLPVASLCLVLLASVVAPSTAAAATPAGRCAAIKLKAVARSTAGQLLCWSRAVRAGEQASGDCIDKAEGKLAFTRIEQRGGCATTGDAGSIGVAIAAFIDDLVAALEADADGAAIGDAETQTCAAAKLRVASRLASEELRCHGRARLNDIPVDDDCLLTPRQRMVAAWLTAEAETACATDTDETSIRHLVEDFVFAVADALPGIPTTTSSTTTTTTLPSCNSSEAPQCDGACPVGSACSIPSVTDPETCVCIAQPLCHMAGTCTGNCGPGATCTLVESACVCL